MGDFCANVSSHTESLSDFVYLCIFFGFFMYLLGCVFSVICIYRFIYLCYTLMLMIYWGALHYLPTDYLPRIAQLGTSYLITFLSRFVDSLFLFLLKGKHMQLTNDQIDLATL